MRVCVTGGAGYIGSVVTEYLLEAGHEVVIVDNLSTGHRAAVTAGITLHEGDLLDGSFMDGVLSEGIEAVCHFAAFSQVGESVEEPLKYYRNNVSGAVTLLGAMKRAGIDRFLFSSTAAVYGEPGNIPIEEDAPLEPVNAYGNTKLAIEMMLADCSKAWGLRPLSLRYFNAAGATAVHGEDHRPETHLIPLVLDAALGRRGELVVFGTDYDTIDGTCVRDYIHVKDLATAHVLGLEKLADGVMGAGDRSRCAQAARRASLRRSRRARRIERQGGAAPRLGTDTSGYRCDHPGRLRVAQGSSRRLRRVSPTNHAPCRTGAAPVRTHSSSYNFLPVS
jgi:UDP-glucose 4-epimerase